MRVLIPFAFAALLAVAPPAAQADDQAQPACPDGQAETPEGCSQQAWVDDCPPDHLCAAAVDGPDEPIAYGNDTCIECSGVADGPAQPQTCMDGAEAGEVCDGDVQTFGPGVADTGSGPGLDGQPEVVHGDADGKEASLLPAAALLAVVLALVAARRPWR
jgi:hypothetical protein